MLNQSTRSSVSEFHGLRRAQGLVRKVKNLGRRHVKTGAEWKPSPQTLRDLKMKTVISLALVVSFAVLASAQAGAPSQQANTPLKPAPAVSILRAAAYAIHLGVRFRH